MWSQDVKHGEREVTKVSCRRSLTEGHDLGEASQECSRHDQDRLGVVMSQIREKTALFTPASCSSPGVTRPSPRQEETGSRR